MADSDEEEEENAENLTGKFFIQSENFQCPTDPILPNGFSSLVVIKDHDFNNQDDNNKQPIIFPPKNHENLLLSIPKLSYDDSDTKACCSSPSYDEGYATSSSSASSLLTSDCFSPSDCNSPRNVHGRFEGLSADVAKCWWWRLGMEALYSKVNGFVLYFRRVFLTFQSPVAMVAVVFAFLYFRWRRRRRQQLPRAMSAEKSNEHLLRVISEKDERITQLLNQIARLNEVLLALHRVPSPKTG